MTDTITSGEILEYLRAFPDATFSEVARTLNVGRDRVSFIAHKNGIYRKPGHPEIMRRRAEILAHLRDHPEESHENVGRKFGISASSVSYLARKRNVRRTGADQEFQRKVVGYVREHPKESYIVIGKQFRCSPGRISRIARDHGIFRQAPWGQVEEKHRKIFAYLRKHQDFQVVENAKALDVSPAYISMIAAKYGLQRQAPKGSGLSIVGRVVRRNGTRSVPTASVAHSPRLVRRLPADHGLDRKIQRAEERLQQLRARKASLKTRMEEDGETITIYGVGGPITRHWYDWLRWLKANGAALLRERCSKLEEASSTKLG